MQRAARLALRGHGGAEPNPLVGCVIVGRDGTLLGEGFHRRPGGPHAEIEALADAARRRANVTGATMYVTLEPCHGSGRTAPCSDAILKAGIARVAIAQLDPHPKGAGGAERLRVAGVRVDLVEAPEAAAVSAPFVHRVVRGLPWVVAKWAQTVDGRVATRAGESRYISGARSRAMVHRERGRVDAILTGIGTVLADDPLLTARGVRLRRRARRVVVDPSLRTPLDSRLVASAGEAPLTVACRPELADDARAAPLRARGAEVVGVPMSRDGGLDLPWLMRRLVEQHETATVLVEAGPRLLGSLFRHGLVNEAWVFTAGILLGDESAVPAVAGMPPLALDGALRLRAVDLRRRGDDIVVRWLVQQPSSV